MKRQFPSKTGVGATVSLLTGLIFRNWPLILRAQTRSRLEDVKNSALLGHGHPGLAADKYAIQALRRLAVRDPIKPKSFTSSNRIATQQAQDKGSVPDFQSG